MLLDLLYSQSPPCGQVRSLCRPLPSTPTHPRYPLLPPHNCCPRRLGSYCLSNDPADNLSSERRPFAAVPRCSFILICASSICTAPTSPSFQPMLYLCASACLPALCSSSHLSLVNQCCSYYFNIAIYLLITDCGSKSNLITSLAVPFDM